MVFKCSRFLKQNGGRIISENALSLLGSLRWHLNSMVNSELLKKVAICGAAISCLGAAFFHHRIQAKIASQDYYKKSVQALRSHQLASDVIGKPIRIPYLNLARKDIRVDHRAAQVVIPVRGSKTSGNLFSFATRKEGEGWVLERVELEVGPEHQRIKILPED